MLCKNFVFFLGSSELCFFMCQKHDEWSCKFLFIIYIKFYTFFVRKNKFCMALNFSIFEQFFISRNFLMIFQLLQRSTANSNLRRQFHVLFCHIFILYIIKSESWWNSNVVHLEFPSHTMEFQKQTWCCDHQLEYIMSTRGSVHLT